MTNALRKRWKWLVIHLFLLLIAIGLLSFTAYQWERQREVDAYVHTLIFGGAGNHSLVKM